MRRAAAPPAETRPVCDCQVYETCAICRPPAETRPPTEDAYQQLIREIDSTYSNRDGVHLRKVHGEALRQQLKQAVEKAAAWDLLWAKFDDKLQALGVVADPPSGSRTET